MRKENIHVMTAIFINLLIMMVCFSTDNPIIILSSLLYCIIIFLGSNNYENIKKGIIFFIPFLFLTIIINIIFVQQGSLVLFKLFGRSFTLESLIYATILSVKLLVIIYIFMVLYIMIDSDKALSYFSSIIPKSTLTLMIALKLFPSMKNRIKNLKEIYSIRGIEFEEKGLKNKIKAYVPVISILLEDSLESAFDIGEAAYVKGFLSGKRSIYERERFTYKDYFLIIICSLILIFFVCFFIKGYMDFNIYIISDLEKALNLYSIFISFFILILSLIFLV